MGQARGRGSLEGVVAQRRTPVRLAGRLLSVRVLDDDANFPDDERWENERIWALETAVAAGARVVNLSLGDSRRPYLATRPTPLAATVDSFVREHGIVVVMSTGDMCPGVYDSDAGAEKFTDRLLGGDDAGPLDSATSALSSTVGALGADEGRGVREAKDSVDVLPFGSANAPSPLTRRGAADDWVGIQLRGATRHPRRCSCTRSQRWLQWTPDSLCESRNDRCPACLLR